jgi:hypothetical protein
MTAPDYPVLTPGGYEMYQLAQIATFVADRLAAHRRSPKGLRGRTQRAAVVRDLAGAATALDRVLDASEPVSLPRPLDRDTYREAAQLVGDGPRTAHVVCLPDAGWAVIGNVPGIGAAGASVPTKNVADALRAHLLSAPLDQIRPWAVTASPAAVPTLPDRVDIAAFVEHLDPGCDRDRAVAQALRGNGRQADAAIRARFPDTAPATKPVEKPAQPAAAPPTTPAASGRHRRVGAAQHSGRSGSARRTSPSIG